MGRAGNQSEVADGNAVSAGILTEWLDDKGYGWVEMEGKSGSSGKVGKGGRRVFAHIKEFGKGQRRPRKGDKVTFKLSRDEQGRPCAVDVRLKSWGGGAWLFLACLLVLPMWAGVKLLGPVFYMLPSWMLVLWKQSSQSFSSISAIQRTKTLVATQSISCLRVSVSKYSTLLRPRP